MIQTNELRIGNWVDWNGEKGIINQILEYEVVFKCGEDTLISDLKPIELTEEILLKCGFVRDGNTGYYTCEKVGFTINLSGTIGYRACIWSNKHINHLHQLQNLYFALTGKELEIEL